MRRMALVVAAVGVVMGWTGTGLAQSTAELLEQAIYAEETAGDLTEAMRLYDAVISQGTGEDVYVARALYRKAMCQVKAGQGAEAEQSLAKLLAEFSGQEQVIVQARQAMNGLRMKDPARLMPPDMLVYAEFGSPGRQLEALLDLLEGTPLENPLELVGHGEVMRPGPLGRLLNPSMINEFKKIQGLAVGVGELGIEPGILAVLYPGQSDVLKGVLEAVIGSIMEPAGELSGLTLFQAGTDMAAAFDDQVILLSDSMDLLQFAVNQYRNHQPEPSLAETREFFTRVPVRARRDRLLTAWADVNQGYRQLIVAAHGDLPPRLAAANALLGLENMEELSLFAGLADDGLALDVEARLGEGRRMLAYDLVRTPNWTASDLPAIPPEAAAVLSLRIGERGQDAAQVLQAPLERWTGLDLGRELFANLEQLTLMAVPAAEAPAAGLSALSRMVVLGLSSRNPDRTRSLLHGLLGPLSHAASQGRTPLSAALPDDDLLAYPVARVDGQPVSVHLGRQGSTTLISLNRDLARGASAGALPAALQSVIAELPPATSKALLVNVGSLVRLQAAAAPIPLRLSGALPEAVEPLADALGQTHLVVRTEEEDNRLAIHLALGPVPRLAGLVPLIARWQTLQSQGALPPPVPTVHTDLTTGAVQLQWTARAGATGYDVRVGTDPAELEPAGQTAAASPVLTLEGLAPDTVYYGRLQETFAGNRSTAGPVWSFATPGVMARYTFDSAAEDGRIEDSSRHGNHGWARGGARILDEYQGRAGVLDCNGLSSSVEIPLSVSNDFTIALWVSTTHPGNPGKDWWEGRGLVDGEVTGPVNDFGTSMLDGKFVFGTGQAERPYNASVWSNGRIDDGAWHHLAAVRDGTTGEQIVYVDGKAEGAATGSTGPKPDPGRLLIGGIQAELEDGYFEGRIDDVLLFNYPLPAAEIERLWRDTRGDAD